MKKLCSKYALLLAIIFGINLFTPAVILSNANAGIGVYPIGATPPPAEYCPQWGWPGIIVCVILVGVDDGNVNTVGNAAWLLGGARAANIGNPAASAWDIYYRDLCVRSAPLDTTDFDENSGELVSGSVNKYDAAYGSLLTGSRTKNLGGDDRKKRACMPLVSTINFNSPTAGSKAFSYYRNANDVNFASDGKGDIAAYKKAYGFTQDSYKSSTFPVNGALGCALAAGADAVSWKKAMNDCYDKYITSRAVHKEWTLERTGKQTDDPLTAVDPDRSIFKNCQPLAEAGNSKANAANAVGKGGYKGYSPVLQYKNRADVDEAEFPVHTPCVAEKGSPSPDVNTLRWSSFNAIAIGGYGVIAVMECIFTLGEYCKGPVFHAPIPDDLGYNSKGKADPKFCPNIEKINDPSYPFAPRLDTVQKDDGLLSGLVNHSTDREYSVETSHLTFKERIVNGTETGYNEKDGLPDEPAVQCAVVPVDIMNIRKEQFDTCIEQRINFNFWSWRFNNFLDWYSLKDSNWKPPCKTRFFEKDNFSDCPVQRSIQQCCRILVKDVTPYNYLKLRTCEGLRQKRMAALKYDHIFDGGGESKNGKAVAYTDYKTAVSENKKLVDAASCDGTEPSTYVFSNWVAKRGYSYDVKESVPHKATYQQTPAEKAAVAKAKADIKAGEEKMEDCVDDWDCDEDDTADEITDDMTNNTAPTLVNELKAAIADPNHSTDSASGNTELAQILKSVETVTGGANEPVNMPYMRWWDTGVSAGNSTHGGSFVNTLGSYDVIIGVGREERSEQDYKDAYKDSGKKMTDEVGEDLTEEEQKNVRTSEMGRINGWEGLKGHQMWTTRRNNLVCIGRHEKLFKQGSLEEFLVSRSGGSYTNRNVNVKDSDGKYTHQIVGKPWNWPVDWQGYSSRSPIGGGAGGDNVKKGNIIAFNISGLSYYAYVTNAHVDSEPKFIEIEAMDQGKFPTSTGASLSWGKITKRTIFKTKVPSYEVANSGKLAGKVALVGDQPSCEDPNFVSCVLPDGGWNSIQVTGFGGAEKCDLGLVKKLMDEKGMEGSDKITNQPQTVPASIWAYCLNAGFKVPDHLKSPDGYNGPGAGAIQDTTLCGPGWGSCSSIGKSGIEGGTKTKCFPGDKAC